MATEVAVPTAPILLFDAVQMPVASGTEPLRFYTLHCPEHGLTTSLYLHRSGPGDDPTVLGNLIGHLRRAGLVDGVSCLHTPKGWRR